MDKRIAVLGILLALSSCRTEPVSCVSDGDCARYGATCDRSAGVCRRLVVDGGGGSDGGVSGDMTPSMCATSADCDSASLPICGDNGLCRACVGAADNSDCAMRSSTTPRCDTSPSSQSYGQCAACRPEKQDVDCLPETPICSTVDGSCRICLSHSECSSGVCKSGGSCALPSEVYYVDNRGAASIAACRTANPTADGSSTNAFCDITDATGAVAARPYVVVKGSGTSYSAVSLTATSAVVGPLRIIGPGHNASPTAKIVPLNGPAISLATSGSDATLVIDGLELTGVGGTPTAAAKCQVVTGGVPTLGILSSYIHNSSGYGVDSANCSLTLDGNVIASNQGGGVSVNGGSVAASNNLIVGNGNAGPGVVFQGSISGTWWFNTVAQNTRTGANAAAFNCSLATSVPVVQASIVWGNAKDGAGSSVGSGCSFSYTDIDDTTTPAGPGNFKMDPLLTSGTLPAQGYRIPSGSPCKDRVTTTSGLGGTLPTHDVDGNPRPRTATGGYDCGGSQAP